MADQQFLLDFEASMGKLGRLNEDIAKNVQDRQTFSATILQQLTEINEKIKQLASKITGLKDKIGTLENQVATHTSGINNKETAIAQLTAKVQQLEDEKQKAQQEFANLTQQTTQKANELQTKINAMESQIEQLTAENSTLKTQSDSLSEQLSNKGSLAEQHAQTIQRQTAEAQQQIASLTEQNSKKIQELTQEIQTKEASITELQTELQKAKAEVAGHLESITNTQGQTARQINDFKRQIQNLTEQNTELQNKIKSATTVINEATQHLDQLTNTDINAENLDGIKKAFNEIEQSIQSINTSIDAAPPGTTRSGPQVKVSEVPIIPLNTMIPFGGTNIQLGTIIGMLKQKNSQMKRDPNNKYVKALSAIAVAATVEEVVNALRGVTYKNNNIMGGKHHKYNKTKKSKKTRKLRKQKGGFKYSSNTKRRSLRSTKTTVTSKHSSG